MIRGVSFEVPQGVIDTLWQILKPLDVTKYRWYNDEWQYEVFPNEQDEELFDSDYYDGQDFLARIQKKFFYLFVKLQAYADDAEFFKIQTYDEFLRSDCKLIVLLYDCEMVEIYAKSLDEIESLYQNAIASDFRHVQFITDENDGRTGMNIS